MKTPILLTKKALLEPINQALERIEKILQRKASHVDSIILEGLFVLAVASFENSLNDTLRVFLKHIPNKLDIKTETVTKEDLIEGNALEKAIDKKIHGVSYKNLKEIIQYFIDTTDIDKGTTFTTHFDKLQEIKATRNLLLHNNLRINSIYNESAGPLRRSSNDQLEITQDYLFESITAIKDVLNELSLKLTEKYKGYTRVNAVKSLWEFIFKTPMMKFEDEWVVDKERDVVLYHNEEKSRRGGLSTSELLFFNIWLSHFKGEDVKMTSFDLYRLDSRNIKKLAYFFTVIDTIKTR